MDSRHKFCPSRCQFSSVSAFLGPWMCLWSGAPFTYVLKTGVQGNQPQNGRSHKDEPIKQSQVLNEPVGSLRPWTPFWDLDATRSDQKLDFWAELYFCFRASTRPPQTVWFTPKSTLTHKSRRRSGKNFVALKPSATSLTCLWIQFFKVHFPKRSSLPKRKCCRPKGLGTRLSLSNLEQFTRPNGEKAGFELSSANPVTRPSSKA